MDAQISNISSQISPILNYQETIKEKASKTTIIIAEDLFKMLIHHRTPSETATLFETVTHRQKEIRELDKRTNKFFRMMVPAVEIEINKLKQGDSTKKLATGFQLLTAGTRDPLIERKLIEAAALPRVKELTIELDKINGTLVDQIILERPSWEAKRSLCLRDIIIKGVALAVLTAMAVSATIISTLTGALPFLVVKGFALGNLLLGLSGGISTFLINRSLKEGSLFGRCKQFFDIHFYFKPEVAQVVCDQIKSDTFRELTDKYDVRNLHRYGFINREARDNMRELIREMHKIDAANQEWYLEHAKEISLYKQNPEDPAAAVVAERRKVSDAAEADFEQKWQLLLKEAILPVLPEDEIKTAVQAVRAERGLTPSLA
jgi:hypothetical protein